MLDKRILVRSCNTVLQNEIFKFFKQQGGGKYFRSALPVSYTHLTLPTILLV